MLLRTVIVGGWGGGGGGQLYVERDTQFFGRNRGCPCGGPPSVALPKWLVYKHEEGGMVTGPVGGHDGLGKLRREYGPERHDKGWGWSGHDRVAPPLLRRS